MAQEGSEQEKKGVDEHVIENKWWVVGGILLGLVVLSWLTHHFGNHKCLNGGIGCLSFVVVVIGMLCAIQQLHALKQVHIENHEWNRRAATQKVIAEYDRIYDKRTALNDKLKELKKPYPLVAEEVIKLFDTAPIMRENCHIVLNYYEELAIGIHWKVYEDKIVKAAMKTKILKTYSIFCNYIISDRIECQQPTLYEYFEKLAKKWEPDQILPEVEATGKKNT